MKDYFLLQYKLSNRNLSDLGINSVFAYVLGLVLVILGSQVLFQKTVFAAFIIVFIGLSFLLKTGDVSRNEFLKTIFNKRTYVSIRILENFVIVLPFLISLILHAQLAAVALLIVFSLSLAIVSVNLYFNFTLPTPFYKWPFEFTVGFRKTWFVFPFLYALTVIAIQVDNLNLGIVSMVLVMLVVSTYYLKPENAYFVWTYISSPLNFLGMKMMIGLGYSFLLVLPVLVLLCVFFPAYIGTIVLFQLPGMVFLCAIIMAKYAAYPHEINMPEAVIFALCIYFPPLILVTIPYYFIKAMRNLKSLLT